MRKNKKRRLLPYILAALISGAVFAATVGFMAADLFFDAQDMMEIEIPVLEGKDESEVDLPESIELQRDYVFSESVAAGEVISQSKQGRVKVARGEKYPLRVSISLGRETRVLPDLRGLDIYEASGILREMGCIPKTVFSESDEPSDSVLFTIPAADTELAAGRTVTLYVATRSQPRTVRVPDFYGCSIDSLQERVESAGLALGKIEFIYSEDFLPNSVIYQSVGEGCLVKYGEKIDFYISKSP